MSAVLWFMFGVLCGGVVGFLVPRKPHSTDVEKSGGTVCTPSKEWVETRNFLYYDGTVMPEIKEDLNE